METNEELKKLLFENPKLFLSKHPEKITDKILQNIVNKLLEGKPITRGETKQLENFLDPWTTASIENKAEILKVGIRTLKRYKSNGCPLDTRAAAERWISENEAVKGSGLRLGSKIFTTNDIIQLTAESKSKDNKLKDLQIKIREIKFQQKQGELVPAWVMQFVLTSITGDLRFQLEKMFTTIAERAKNPADPDRIKIVMREELETFYQQLNTASERAKEQLDVKLKEEATDDEAD
jgi:phage terminase Nu1 subunit (DNA packaging protein)